MAPRKCLSCRKRNAGLTTVLVTQAKRGAREWTVLVCQECWDCLEAMLDEAAVSRQPDLEYWLRHHTPWFRGGNAQVADVPGLEGSESGV